MHTNACSAPQARGVIESASHNRNVSQREVAETILRAPVMSDMSRPGEGPPA